MEKISIFTLAFLDIDALLSRPLTDNIILVSLLTNIITDIRFFITSICIVFGLTTSGLGQTSDRDSAGIGNQPPPKRITWITTQTPNINEFSIWAGYAFDSFQLWGKTPGATLSLLGIRYNRKFLNIYNTTLEYTLDVSLHARYTYPEFSVERRKSSLTGAGFSPFGLQSNFFTHNRLQPFLKTSGGFMFLSQPFPDIRGEKINFTFGAGGGLEYMLTPNASISLGYRFFHLSNGETGQVNPGIDSSFFYGGVTLF